MKNIQKNFLFLVAMAFVLLVGGVFYSVQSKIENLDDQVSEMTPVTPESNRIVLVIDFGDGSKRSFRAQVAEEKRAWSYLQQVAAVAGLVLETEGNFSPARISDRRNGDDGKKWNFYLNNVKKEESPFDLMVRPPAELKFVFE